MSNKRLESKNGDMEDDIPDGPARRNSGIRSRCDAEMERKLRSEIEELRKERFLSGYPVRMESDNITEKNSDKSTNADDRELRMNSYDCESPYFDGDKLKDIIVRNCGKIYWDFLDSGHPLARFWVQLKNGLQVLPRSEYVYYIQSVLGRRVEDGADMGSSRLKMEFMKKYGFESDEEVEEYLLTILDEDDVENIIGVE